jgi:colanic acid/amylovoran biosynthesis glycosyltransferase
MKKKSLRVIIFRNTLINSSETFIRSQAEGLLNWSPILVGHKYAQNGLNIDHLPSALIHDPKTITHSKLIESIRYWLGLPTPKITAQIEKLNADAIHIHFATDAVKLWPQIKHSNLPVIITLHGFDICINKSWWIRGNSGTRNRAYPYRLKKLAHQKNVRFVAVSKQISKKAEEYGIPKDKVSIIYNGVDTNIFTPNYAQGQTRKRILFIGRLVEKKAPLDLIEAVKIVSKNQKNITLTIVGDGPLKHEVMDRAKILGIAFEYHTYIANDDIPKLLQASSVLCLPSVKALNGDMEGMPIVILEAQSAGVPVVTTLSAAGEEVIINGVTGSIVEESNPIALAKALSYWLDQGSPSTLKKAIHLHAVNNFDISNSAKLLERTYNESTINSQKPNY